MAADYYSNPFEAINPQSFGGTNPTTGAVNPLTTFYASNKAAQAQPFIDMARQSGMLDLQQKQQQNAEAMSPEAVAARKSALEWTTTENKNKIQTDLAKTNAAIEDMKASAQQKRGTYDKIQAEIGQIHATGMDEMMTELAGVGSSLKGAKGADGKPLSDDSKSLLYTQALTRIQAKHPDLPLPQQFSQTWNSDLESNLDTANFVALNSNKFKQEKALQAQKDAADLKRTQVSAGAQIEVGRANNATSAANAELAYGSKQETVQANREKSIGEMASKFLQADLNYMAASPEEQAKKRDAAIKSAIAGRKQIEQEFGSGGGQPQGDEKPPVPVGPVPSGKVRVYSPKLKKYGFVPSGDLNRAISEGYQEVK